MKEDKIPCPTCKKIMIADLHKNNPEWDNWICPDCEEDVHDRDDVYIKRCLAHSILVSDNLIWTFWLKIHESLEFLFRGFFLKCKLHTFIDNKLFYYEKKYLKKANKIMDLKVFKTNEKQ